LGAHDIIVHWKPPRHPNGIISYYEIKGVRDPAIDMFNVNKRDYCTEPLSYDALKRAIADEKASAKHWLQNQTSTLTTEEETVNTTDPQCCSCHKSLVEVEEEANKKVDFEDYLINTAYIRKNEVVADTFSENITRRRRQITDKNGVNLLEHLENETQYWGNDSLTETKFDFQYLVQDTFIKISNLTHFTEYNIEVRACQEGNDSIYTHDLCSVISIISTHTLPQSKHFLLIFYFVKVLSFHDLNLFFLSLFLSPLSPRLQLVLIISTKAQFLLIHRIQPKLVTMLWSSGTNQSIQMG
jgi:hypothetical protein